MVGYILDIGSAFDSDFGNSIGFLLAPSVIFDNDDTVRHC